MYDPISDASIPNQLSSPESYWANDSASQLQYAPLRGDIETDVAIIGGGYTGLSAALHLSKNFGRKALVIEANQPGWGCSGRNGGFVLPGTGRLSVNQLCQKWGANTAKAIYEDYLGSVNLVKNILDASPKRAKLCEYTQGGYLKLAHRPQLLSNLHAQATLLNDEFGDDIIALSASDVKQNYLSATQNLSNSGSEAGMPIYGGIYYPQAFGLNPWQLCQLLAAQASDEGAKIVGNTSVLKCERLGYQHYIRTQQGNVVANTLILASNAYGQRSLHTAIKDRLFPVMSSILVTSVLNDAQLSALGMRSGLMLMDTRPLKYYYRLLPNNRLLFGARGAIKGKHADTAKSQQKLFKGLVSTFPQLRELSIEKFWSGWVAVSLDDYPRVYHDRQNHLLYSGGYCGAGLAFSIQAGMRLAQLLCAPDQLPDLPYWNSALKRFPFAGLRRSALSGLYAWENVKSKFKA